MFKDLYIQSHIGCRHERKNTNQKYKGTRPNINKATYKYFNVPHRQCKMRPCGKHPWQHCILRCLCRTTNLQFQQQQKAKLKASSLFVQIKSPVVTQKFIASNVVVLLSFQCHGGVNGRGATCQPRWQLACAFVFHMLAAIIIITLHELAYVFFAGKISIRHTIYSLPNQTPIYRLCLQATART